MKCSFTFGAILALDGQQAIRTSVLWGGAECSLNLQMGSREGIVSPVLEQGSIPPEAEG